MVLHFLPSFIEPCSDANEVEWGRLSAMLFLGRLPYLPENWPRGFPCAVSVHLGKDVLILMHVWEK